MLQMLDKITLPLSDSTQIFLLVLIIILLAPLLNKIKIPHIIGLIVAGMVFGPYGLNVLAHDASFDLFGKVGILYIMFLAGLEIDMNSFRQNRKKGIIFGLYTFVIPMVIGIAAGMLFLDMNFTVASLLASMFASHTLIAYPIVSQLGIAKHRAVSITVSGTIITVAGALLILAIVVADEAGGGGLSYWLWFSAATIIFSLITFLVLPRISKYLLSRFNNHVSQYIYVLAIVFIASLLAEMAGLEGILGAFFAGLILNKLIPNESTLMKRIEFVGNAIFIPFFLISIGMLINLKVLFTGWESLKVSVVMSVVATASKWIAAKLTEKTCRLSPLEGTFIFGLSNGQAAATLAAVLIGYNIGLLNEAVLNGTVVMILVTCAISSIVTERSARKMFLAGQESQNEKPAEEAPVAIAATPSRQERILIPISNPSTMPQLLELSDLLKEPGNHHSLYALSNIGNNVDNAKKLMHKAIEHAQAANNHLNPIFKTDINVTNGIIEAIEENNITDVIMGVHYKANFVDTFLGPIITQLIEGTTRQTLFIYGPKHSAADTSRIIVIAPPLAECESGFAAWVERMGNIAARRDSGIVIYSNSATRAALEKMPQLKNTEYKEFESIEQFDQIARDIRQDDAVVFISARRGSISFSAQINKIPYVINKYLSANNFILVYPEQHNIASSENSSYSIVTMH